VLAGYPTKNDASRPSVLHDLAPSSIEVQEGRAPITHNRKEIGDLGPRSLLQEAVNSNQPVEVIAQIARLKEAQKDGPRTVQPWNQDGYWIE
jgi:hypothetical protein